MCAYVPRLLIRWWRPECSEAVRPGVLEGRVVHSGTPSPLQRDHHGRQARQVSVVRPLQSAPRSPMEPTLKPWLAMQRLRQAAEEEA